MRVLVVEDDEKLAEQLRQRKLYAVVADRVPPDAFHPLFRITRRGDRGDLQTPIYVIIRLFSAFQTFHFFFSSHFL